MEANEILLKVKEFFNELVNPTPVQNEVMPIEVETKDGVKITVDKLEVGGVAMVDGVAAPIGEHTLTDGTVIMVTDNGVIAEIKPKVEEVAPIVEDETVDMNARFAAYDEKFTAFENAANEKFAAYEAKLSQANKVIQGLIELSAELAKQPVSEPDQVIVDKSKFSASALFSKKK
jgi:hypothetical protein